MLCFTSPIVIFLMSMVPFHNPFGKFGYQEWIRKLEGKKNTTPLYNKSFCCCQQEAIVTGSDCIVFFFLTRMCFSSAFRLWVLPRSKTSVPRWVETVKSSVWISFMTEHDGFSPGMTWICWHLFSPGHLITGFKPKCSYYHLNFYDLIVKTEYLSTSKQKFAFV